MPPEREEVVVRSDPFELEHRGEGAGDARLDRRARRHPGHLGAAGAGVRQEGAAVDLAVGGERQRVEHHEEPGNHVGGQAGAQPPAQLLAPRLGRARLPGALDEPDQPRRRSLALNQHGALLDPRAGGERRLDLAQLHAEAAELHLVVDPALEVEPAAVEVADQVAGAVEAAARLPARARGEGIGEVALGGQRRAAEVAAREPAPPRWSSPGTPGGTGEPDRSSTKARVPSSGRPIVGSRFAPASASAQVE